MTAKQNILLCYTQEDNKKVSAASKGWVANFHKFLSNLLHQISRTKPNIQLMSEKDLDKFNPDDFQAVIIISTQALEEQTAFTRKINEFANHLKKSNALYVDGISRIFKVHKRPYSEGEQLGGIQNMIAYDFYLIDPLTGEAQEFTQFFGNDAERSYWMKMVDMAYDLNQLMNASKDQSAEMIPREKTVYLASTGMDLMIQRDIIKRELIRHGYRVLPHHTLPKEIDSLEKVIKEDLAQSRMSIHMVGEDYGYKPLGSEISVVDLQNRLASSHLHKVNEQTGEDNAFSRLIWVSPDLKNVTERQKIFIEDLKSDAALLEDAEVLQIPLSEFKSIIREELDTGGRFRELRELRQQSKESEGNKMIYVIHDKADVDSSQSLINYLNNFGYKVVSPRFEGNLAQIRTSHLDNLRSCDGSIIYFGKSKEGWIRTKLQDLLKAPGFGREKKLLAKAVYCDGKKEIDLAHYERNNAMVLGNNGGFKPEHLEPFLSKMENK